MAPRGRPVGSKSAAKKVAKPLKKKCFDCENEKLINLFYKSNNSDHKYGVFNFCKDCSRPLDINNQNEVRIKLAMLKRPFIASIWEKALTNAKTIDGVFGKYLVIIQMKDSQYALCNENFVDDSVKEIVEVLEIEPTNNDNPQENKNKEDVLRMLGYDPFAKENESDKLHLHNKLVDFLDESTLEDSFKLPVVIEIVKTFNQIDKLNNALTGMMSEDKMADNSKKINDLMTTKNNMYKSVLALAKDNGISVNHNNNKSKGGNTLNGIVKKLNEIGLKEAEVNLFDLETCDAMKQIADFSNRSIVETLMLDENDYTGMIVEQKSLIKKLNDKLMVAEEENRLLKIKIKNI